MTSFTSRYGNPALDYKGAHVRAYCRHGATVIAVSGRVDAGNVERVTESTCRVVTAGTRVVLDLSGVSAFTPRATQLLSTFDRHCLTIDVDWALVPSDAVARRMHVDLTALPVIGTVAAAEHQFDDAILRRRGLLMPMLRRTA